MSSSAPNDPGESSVQSASSKAKSLGKAFSQMDIDGHDLPPSPAPSSPRNGKRYALATELVYTEGTDQYNASSTPIYQVGRSATFQGACDLQESYALIRGRGTMLKLPYSPQLSSKLLEVEVVNMITHAQEIRQELT